MRQEAEKAGELELRGLLTGDSVEGGGTFLLQPGGKRYELLVNGAVAIPDAGAGAPVVVFGRLAPEIASFRQQGTLFQVTRIELDSNPSA